MNDRYLTVRQIADHAAVNSLIEEGVIVTGCSPKGLELTVRFMTEAEEFRRGYVSIPRLQTNELTLEYATMEELNFAQKNLGSLSL